MKTLIVGDLHGDFSQLIDIVKRGCIETILQCGDFGYWKYFKHTITSLNTQLKKYNVILYWCDGNHEQFPYIGSIETSNIIYKKRNSVLTLPDGHVILFIGGADSIDKKYRTVGYDWFPEYENISLKTINNLPDIKINTVISHTAPEYFDLRLDKIGRRFGIDISTYVDNNRKLLNMVYDKYKPDKWYFGHFHKHMIGMYNDCYWTLLSDTLSKQKWYCEL